MGDWVCPGGPWGGVSSSGCSSSADVGRAPVPVSSASVYRAERRVAFGFGETAAGQA